MWWMAGMAFHGEFIFYVSLSFIRTGEKFFKTIFHKKGKLNVKRIIYIYIYISFYGFNI